MLNVGLQREADKHQPLPETLKNTSAFLNAGSLLIKSKGGQTFQRFPLRRRSRSLAAQLDSVTPKLLQYILLSEEKKTPPICQKHTPPSQTQHSISSISRKSLGGKPIMLISQESEATSLGRVFYWSNICYPHRNHFPLNKKKKTKKRGGKGEQQSPAGGRRILRGRVSPITAPCAKDGCGPSELASRAPAASRPNPASSQTAIFTRGVGGPVRERARSNLLVALRGPGSPLLPE